MNFRSTVFPALAIAFGVIFTSAHAQAADYTTVLSLQQPTIEGDPVTPYFEQVIFRWSTNVTSGTVGQNDLSEFSLEVYESSAGGACAANTSSCRQIYYDQIITGGVIQPLPGLTRIVNGIGHVAIWVPVSFLRVSVTGRQDDKSLLLIFISGRKCIDCR